MSKAVTVLLVENGKYKVDLIDITPNYPTIKAIIGGDIMEVRLDDETVILCEDACPPQVIPELFRRTIWGRCFIVIGRDPNDGKYRSLTAKSINKYKSEFEGYGPREVRLK
jgi:hypothetical protein